VDSLLTAEVTAADGADDNDVDGDAEGDDSMVGQWELTKAEEVEQARTEGTGRGVDLLL
jgi:hypothetical protein